MAARPSSVIMQPTTLCNLNCSYCYLPDRRHVCRMLPAVAQAVATSVAPWTERTTVEVCWHGGEPLTAGRAYLGRLMDHFAGLDVVHSVQTNATLVDREWADFLAERRINVGVSIDGPPKDNQQRADWAGRPAFARIVRGIRLLVTREMIVSVIAVVSDPTPERARKLYTFVVELGATWLGVNIEELKGSNKRRTAPPESQVTDFWAALVEAWQANPTVQLREVDRALSYARYVLNDEHHDEIDHTSTPLDPLPTIAWNGGVTLISPELAGFRSDRHGDFACGNVFRTPLDQLIQTGMRATWVREYQRGIAECRIVCPYFAFCGGGYPSNRYFEHGRMDGTETDYCRNSKIALMEGVISLAARHEPARRPDTRP
ncbi:MAG: cyclophane-forming radical SAM peptide maturase AmcB [Pseudonocardiaceae bacterium]